MNDVLAGLTPSEKKYLKVVVEKYLEILAKKLFDERPHNNRTIPQWEEQPEHIKQVFRNFISRNIVTEEDLRKDSVGE